MLAKYQKIKNPHKEKAILKTRLIVIATFVIFMTFLIIARLIFLQVSQYEEFNSKSLKNQFKLEPLAAKRGLIYDRNNVLLADNVPAHRLEIIPSKSKDIDATLKKLKKIINISDDEIKKFKQQFKKTNKTIVLKMYLTEEEVALLYMDKYQYPEIKITSYLIRKYPYGIFTSAILGYVSNAIEAYDNYEENLFYQVNPFDGKLGIEKKYEKILRGKIGYKKFIVNSKGKKIKNIDKEIATPGNDLILTIDVRIQKVAQKALGNESGAIVAIDNSNGEILALASNPSYDSNIFVKSIDNNINSIISSESKPMFNRAINGQFPLASTIKPFLSLTALDKEIISKDYSIDDHGSYSYSEKSHVYHDWDLNGHGIVNLERAIIISCDTYFYQLAVKMGIENIFNILHKFGFGQKTNIDIGDESTGIAANPKWKKSNIGNNWYISDTILSGIGQGYMLTTPIQLAQATAILANRGISYQPHLVKTIINHNGENQIITKKGISAVTLKKETWYTIISAMNKVLTDASGTGFRFGKDYNYTVAAKTGTAQLYTNVNNSTTNRPKKLREHSLFIGFSPVNNSRISVAVIAENSNIAPLAARKVFDEYYKIYGAT